ncbi:MAG: heparinase II/III domain-containing protein, partial [Armatimonadota bacterium]
MVKRYPRIPDMYRLYVDTWCFQQYYPNIGHAQDFAVPNTSYAGMSFAKGLSFTPSALSYFWELYKLTGDPIFVQLLYQGNGNTVEGLLYDIFADDPNRFQEQLKEIISKVGPLIKEIPSVNKYKWHLAILRSGQARNGRALWIDYDSSGRHGHDDGMNIGLYAKGLDLLPDFGYKPLQYGGWHSYKATWYGIWAAHNTVVVDGWSQYSTDGICML